MNLGLENSAILVTGATGGIGSAIARSLADEGARVLVHYRSKPEAASSLADELGGVAIGADLRDESQVDRLVDEAVRRLGRLDGAVANAGTWPTQPLPVADMPLDRWRATIDANLTATFLTCRAYLRHARAAGRGSLVLIASTAGQFGEAGHADYAAAKAAIAYGMARSLKNEIATDAPAVRVNVVSPGWTASPMTAGKLDEAAIAHATATMALPKIAQPADIAAAVAWLLSPTAAGHVTGHELTVAGGMEGRLLRSPSPGVS